VATAVTARFQNCGQSCIAAKRFIVQDSLADAFVEAFKARVEALTPGDPAAEGTRLAPMARADLRSELHAQATDSVSAGARVVAGMRLPEGEGFFYPASILDRVAPGMRAFDEELFGPVATVTRVRDEDEAVRLANASRYGLGGSVWTGDPERGERVALALECGSAFVNGLVKSDPRLPFGGVKDSGYGRELSRLGIHEFVNHKTVWIR
jgi:succinate-semialdehyde dehydrogenase/glutarate-semialdehyde dehydrogenase